MRVNDNCNNIVPEIENCNNIVPEIESFLTTTTVRSIVNTSIVGIQIKNFNKKIIYSKNVMAFSCGVKTKISKY